MAFHNERAQFLISLLVDSQDRDVFIGSIGLYSRTEDLLWHAAQTLNWRLLKWFRERTMKTMLPTCIDGFGDIRNEKGDTLLHVLITNELTQNEERRLHEMVLAVAAVVDNNPKVHKIINARNAEGKSPLHVACSLDVKRSKDLKNEFVELLNLLVRAGADVNLRFKDGIRPLHIAHESPWAVECLISHGADVNVRDTFSRTPFIWMLRNPHFPLPPMIPVSTFARAGYDFKYQKDYMGNAAVHYAIYRSRFASTDTDIIHLFEQLTRFGADVNAQNRRLQTPLFIVIHEAGLTDLAKCLLSNGANINLCDADGYTVVSLAAMMSKIDFLKLLIPRLSHNFVTPTGETVEDLIRYYVMEDEIDEELSSMMNVLNSKELKRTERTYKKPYSVWKYIEKLLSYPEMVSLYVVDTFYRYQGGRAIFSDFFLNISHGAEIRRKALQFKERLLSWNGQPDELVQIIERFSVGDIHATKERCSCAIEDCWIAYEVRQAVEKLMTIVMELDTEDRFQLNVVPVGSSMDGSKIFLPDEFDFLIVFQRYPSPKSVEEKRENLISLVEYFRLLLVRAMQFMDRTLLGEREPLQFLFVDCELRRVCLNIRMIWRGSKYGKLFLSIDLTPVFQFDGWDDRYGLRPLNELPVWFQKSCSGQGYFRSVYNFVKAPPITPIAERKAMNLQKNLVGLLCLRLLKMVVQTNFVIKNVQSPNSYCLRLAIFLWCIPDENMLPDRNCQIAAFVADIARRFTGEWDKEMPYFASRGTITTRFPFLFQDLVEVLERRRN